MNQAEEGFPVMLSWFFVDGVVYLFLLLVEASVMYEIQNLLLLLFGYFSFSPETLLPLLSISTTDTGTIDFHCADPFKD